MASVQINAEAAYDFRSVHIVAVCFFVFPGRTVPKGGWGGGQGPRNGRFRTVPRGDGGKFGPPFLHSMT